MKCFYTIDWLEIQTTWHPDDVESIMKEDRVNVGEYTLVKREYGTRVFSLIVDVLYKCKDFGTITALPISNKMNGGILDPTLSHFKLNNYYLYTDGWLKLIDSCFGLLRIKPIQVSRVDIACDWQYSRCGLSAKALMEGLAKGKYRKVHQPSWSMYAIDGQNGLWYNGMSFGSKTSSNFTRFYNKSHEMRVKKDKIYIKEWWRNAGLNMEEDVYRVEVEVKTIGRKSIERETGEIITIDWRELDNRDNVQKLFLYISAYYFDIRKNDKKRKTECTRLDIFDPTDMNYKAWQNPKYEVTTRTDKLVLNYMRKRIDSGDVHPAHMEAYIETTTDLYFNKMSKVYALSKIKAEQQIIDYERNTTDEI